jgi:hypothetical protein
MIVSGRIRAADPLIVAGQFLSATHGYVLLQSRGTFGSPDRGIAVMAELALNLMVGLGDDRAAAERSLQSAILARLDQ